MTKRTKFILLSPLFLTAFLLLVALAGYIVQQLWNYLLPPLFAFPAITLWQALALLVLCRILFGGHGSSSGMKSDRRNRFADRIADRVAERMAERYDAMTPEEQERFRQRMRERWGVDPATGPTPPL